MSKTLFLHRCVYVTVKQKLVDMQGEDETSMKKTVKVVGAVTSNENGDILCALRSPEMSLPNLWEFPGGKIEEGEQPEDSLIREIEEELGCMIEVQERIEDIVHDYLNIDVSVSIYG